MTTLDSLPNEILSQISHYGPGKPLKNFRLVNKRFAAVSKDGLFANGIFIWLRDPEERRYTWSHRSRWPHRKDRHWLIVPQTPPPVEATSLALHLSEFGLEALGWMHNRTRLAGRNRLRLKQYLTGMRAVTLTCEQSDIRLDEIMEALSAARNLEVLRLRKTPFVRDPLDSPQDAIFLPARRWFPNLHNLSIHCFKIPPLSLSSVVERHKDTLKHFELQYPPDATLSWGRYNIDYLLCGLGQRMRLDSFVWTAACNSRREDLDRIIGSAFPPGEVSTQRVVPEWGRYAHCTRTTWKRSRVDR